MGEFLSTLPWGQFFSYAFGGAGVGVVWKGLTVLLEFMKEKNKEEKDERGQDHEAASLAIDASTTATNQIAQWQQTLQKQGQYYDERITEIRRASDEQLSRQSEYHAQQMEQLERNYQRQTEELRNELSAQREEMRKNNAELTAIVAKIRRELQSEKHANAVLRRTNNEMQNVIRRMAWQVDELLRRVNVLTEEVTGAPLTEEEQLHFEVPHNARKFIDGDAGMDKPPPVRDEAAMFFREGHGPLTSDFLSNEHITAVESPPIDQFPKVRKSLYQRFAATRPETDEL